MSQFTEKQKSALYMLGLDTDQMTDDEQKEIYTEMENKSCNLDQKISNQSDSL